MKRYCTLALFLLSGVCFGQSPIDKGFYGRWNLDVAKSKFEPASDAPKFGIVAVSQNGYILAGQDAAGQYILRGAALVGGQCYLLGTFPANFSCTVESRDPRRPVLTVKQDQNVVIKLEPELTSDTTMTVKTTGVSPKGEPTRSQEVYTKAVSSSTTSKK